MRRRTMILRVVVVLVLLMMAGRLAWFQVVKAEEVVTREEEWRLQKESITPVRGALKDRAGRYLAVSIPTRNVIASPYHIGSKNFEAVAGELANHLPLTKEEIKKAFQEKESSQFLVLMKGIDLQTAAKIEERGLPGISLLPAARRTYPQGTTANHLIGYLDFEGNGAYGLEARYNKELKGKEGFVRAELTHGKMPIEGTVKSQVAVEPGLDVTVTIDAYLNKIFEEALDRVMKEQDAKRALAIAMDVKTGEILAMAMRPGADPGDWKTWLGPDGKPDYGRVNNWAVTPLPPGSIFKTITTAIALEERLIDLNTLITDEGKMVIDGWVVTNWDRHIPVQPKPMTITELMQTSSNIGLIKVGQRIPNEIFVKYLRGFGFMEPTGLDFNHEDGAVGLAGFDKKSRIDWANMYIGQHLEVTPVQMVTAVAAIANGGYLVQPRLVKDLRDPEGKVVWTAPTSPRRQVISQQTAKEVRELMVSVVEKGTGKAALLDGYTMGGKTGTAQKYEGGKEKERGLADFIGFAPASNPRVALMVLIDEPRPPGYGGQIAAPLFKELMPHVLQSLAIPPDRPDKPQAAPAPAPGPKEAAQVPVPDVRFLPVAWAEQKLNDAGFTPRRVGEGGVVTAQSLAAGSKAKAGAEVELKLAPQAADKLQVPDFRGLTLAEASRLATEVGVTLKQAGGSGFVVEQNPGVGATVEPGAVLTVRLSAVRSGQP
ncbi:MAG: penicillin-binding transpeptidase domain-containing protein [Bacillota bacterium]